ncbi:hypothetical protein [Microbacterium paraoxydans]|uniref:hypothetical protein n=1 Tax=Microbacterium paraoxydans TaxID=199592 RepID=UPI003013B19A
MTEGRDEPRQRVVRVPGSRRARLTPVEGSDPAPEVPEDGAPRRPAPGDGKGPNDDQLLRDVPPHY